MQALGEDGDAAGRRTKTLRVLDLVKEYKTGSGVFSALKGITLDVFQGEYISIMGPSGSGKTTFFNMIGGLQKASSGRVFIDDVDIARLSPDELAWLRCRKIGYIFQTYNLIPSMSAIDNVLIPLVFGGMTDDEGRARAETALRMVGLGDRLFHKPFELSGGQQQRVAIARAFAPRPSIILADEPTANLDTKTGAEIIDTMSRMNRSEGVTIITATHDYKMISASDRIVFIVDGRVDRIQRRSEFNIEVGGIDEAVHPATSDSHGA